MYGLSKLAAIGIAIVVIIVVSAAVALLYYQQAAPATPSLTVTTSSPTVTTETTSKVTATQTPTTSSPATTSAAQGFAGVIKIGTTISEQGKFAHEGKQALCGFKLAVEWVNNHGGVVINGKRYKLELVYYDDKSDKAEVPKLFTRLITVDKVNFLIAPYSSSLTLAAVPIAEQYHKVILSHGGASDAIFTKGYKYIIQILSPASYYMKPAIDFLKSTGDKDIKIAFIYEDAAFAKSVMEAAKKYAKEAGFKIVLDQTYPKGTTDFSQIIEKAKAAGANVLLGGGHFQDGLQLVKQAHDLGLKLKFISILVAPTLPDFYKNLGPSIAEGVTAPAQWEVGVKYSPELAKKMGLEWYGPTNEEYVKAFKKECGMDPDYHAAEASAAILFLVKAIEKAGTLDNDKVREAANTLKIMTFFGPLWIDPKTGKQVGHPVVLIQWQNGKKEIIWPPEAATAKPVYPIPNWWGKG
ncbi:MAG: amino acid ABC transporter substrate-binding protein [Pyrodictiaceae archaeon]